VEASDGNSNTGTLDVTVTVTNVNEKPVVSGSASVTKQEGADRTVGTYTATDPDAGASVTWTLSGTDAADFEISTGGVLSFAQAPDLEDPQDSDTDNEYSVTVKASDGSLEDTLDVTVTVSGVNDSPSITGGPASVSYAENDSAPVGTYTATDPEDDTITWSLAGTDAADFSIASDGGVLTFASSPDFEVPVDADTNNVYSVTVRASDGNTRVTRDVTVTVTGVNEAPVISGDATKNYAENGTGAVATYTATDPESDTITWSLSGTDAADLAISTGGVLTFASSPDFESPVDSNTNNVYSVTVEASDGNGNTGTLDVTVTVTNVNEPPVVSGDATKNYAENGTDAVASYTAADPEGDSFTWSLSGTDAADFSITSAGGVLSFASSPDYESAADADTNNVYSVTVEAKDSNNNTGTLDLTVTVTGVDEPPTLTGPASVTRTEGTDRTVATYTATDPENASINWWLTGTDGSDFDITNGVLTFKQDPDREDPHDANEDNVYAVTVWASDGNHRDSLAVTVTVSEVNDPPAISGGPTDPSYAENGTGPVATYSATDPENDTITWSLSGTDAADFSITSDGGVLTFVSSPDYEGPADADTDNAYSVTVEASDGNTEATLDVTVTVTDVDEAPTPAGPSAVDFAENSTGDVATYTALDPENDAVTWSLSGTDEDAFTIGNSGVLRFKSPPDRETKSSYSVTVTATAGGKSTPLDVTVTVTDVNEPPEPGPAPNSQATVSVEEGHDGPVGSYVANDPEEFVVHWSLGGRDSGDFTISTDGELSFVTVPDFEAPQDSSGNNVYDVTLRAFDGTHTGTLDVTVTVTNVEEPGVVQVSNVQPQVGVPLQATLADPDGTISGISWTLPDGTVTTSSVRGFTPSPVVAVSGNFAVVLARATSAVPAQATSPVYVPDPDDVGEDLTFGVSYVDRHGTTKTTTVESDNPVRVAPDTNSRPEFESTSTTRSVAEKTPPGTAIGDPVTASDPGDPLTYTLGGADAALFDINRATGLLLTKAVLDREARSSYRLRVTATDPSLAAASVTVTITVTDVEEPPVLTGDAVVFYPSGETRAVFTYRATDPERQSITWSRSGDDSGQFTISGGRLRFREPPDHATPRDTNGDNIYEITVTATDPAGHATDLDVRVAVTEQRPVPPSGPSSTPGSSGVGGGGVGGGGVGGGSGPSGPSPAAGPAGVFGDVAGGAYYAAAVSTLAGRGVFAGTECRQGFCPGEAIDRKTVAVWLVRVLDGKDPSPVSTSRFADVEASRFHAPFIERLAELGVTQGCKDGSGFCPDRTVTRAQMAVFLSRAYKLGQGPAPAFVDVPSDAWYAEHVARLAASGITTGCGDGTGFCPKRDTLRAQMAAFLYRAQNRTADS